MENFKVSTKIQILSQNLNFLQKIKFFGTL